MKRKRIKLGTPEYKKMISERSKKMWDDPEKRAKIIAFQKGKGLRNYPK